MRPREVTELVQALKEMGASGLELTLSDDGVTGLKISMAPEQAPAVDSEMDDFVKVHGQRPVDDMDAQAEWDRKLTAHYYYRSS